jgi:type II secretory pathway predicted ATPase ExeA
MYYEYWGLKKPPFDNVPDPSMYVDCHRSMENAMAETLFAIEEGDDRIAVIVGDAGLGKTLSIRMMIDSLKPNRYKIVLIINPGISYVQMLQEIIGQLTGTACLENEKMKLLEIFNDLLLSTWKDGKKVLIFIDEANAITPINLENLRLLTNLQDHRKNLFTMILAGQNVFAHRLEHPKRANLFQRIGTYSRIDKLDCADDVKIYVETRLKLVGARRQLFTEDSFDRIWEHSEYGIPRLINKLCKLCLKTGEVNHLPFITGRLVDEVGVRINKLLGPAIPTRKSRRRSQIPLPLDYRKMPALPFHGNNEESCSGIFGNRRDRQLIHYTERNVYYHRMDEVPSIKNFKIARCVKREPIFLIPKREYHNENTALMVFPSKGKIKRINYLLHSSLYQGPNTMVADIILLPAGQVAEEFSTKVVSLPAIVEAENTDPEETFFPDRNEPPVDPEFVDDEYVEEIQIGDITVRIDIPEYVIALYRSSNTVQCYKIAGTIAAETLKKNPQLTQASPADPVPIWQEIRDFVLTRFRKNSVL